MNRQQHNKPDDANEQCVRVLQGGGALGAYQAGVYAELAPHGHAPNWIAGISIGAINAALIVGNPPERRAERLREFSRFSLKEHWTNGVTDVRHTLQHKAWRARSKPIRDVAVFDLCGDAGD